MSNFRPPAQASSLARNHPDHPKLADLGVKEQEANASLGHGSLASPPPTTETPGSMSDAESAGGSTDPSSAGSMGAKRAGGLFSEGPNARSKSVTVADGDDTYGALNCHPTSTPNSAKSKNSSGSEARPLKGTFRVGVSEDKNKRCRRTMEDSHSFVYDYAGIRGQGYFAVFDGHAGKHAAEWCGQNFHEYLLDATLTHPDQPIPDLLNKTFHVVDSRLSQLAQAGKTHSGCTAVTAFLRVEQDIENEPKGFTNPGLSPRGLMEGKGEAELEAQTSLAEESRRSSIGAGTGGGIGGVGASGNGSGSGNGSLGRKMSGRKIRDFVRGLTGTEKKDDEGEGAEDSHMINTPDGNRVEAIEPKSEKGLKKVLYTANVGDARAVLCRGGKAVRLTYDHKGSDSQEAKRITDAGGFVMNNRVNGVLAVTRSLGDASMKEFVVGSPYTTETNLDETDEFLIVACDGLWDVAEDQEAVDLIKGISDPQEASKRLLDYAMTNYSTDNLSVMVVRFYH